MFVVGLTGGIGSGKTTVSDMFANLGIDIVDTDVIARQVVEVGSEALQKIQAHFGDTILQADSSLDRKKLREIIFNDTSEKSWLENLLHPLIRLRTTEALKSATSPYVILSSPLLIESPDLERIQRLAVVDIPVEQQRARTLARDTVTINQINKTIAAQISRDARLKHADDVIDNSGSLENTQQQVLALHTKYLKLVKTH